MSLRSSLLRLARAQPEVRKDVLTLLARYQPSATQAIIQQNTIEVRIPVTGDVTQADWKSGMVDMAREVGAILRKLKENGVDAKAGGTSMATREPAAFVNRIRTQLMPKESHKLEAILLSVPNLRVRR